MTGHTGTAQIVDSIKLRYFTAQVQVIFWIPLAINYLRHAVKHIFDSGEGSQLTVVFVAVVRYLTDLEPYTEEVHEILSLSRTQASGLETLNIRF